MTAPDLRRVDLGRTAPLHSRRAVMSGLVAAGVVTLDATGRLAGVPSAIAAPGGWAAFHEYRPPVRPVTVNVRDHGAVGDGRTNDIAAFRSAMAVLADAGGGTLVVPEATYVVNGEIVLADNVHITSPGAVLYKTAPPYAWFVSLSGQRTGFGSGARNVWVEGLTFRADYGIPFTACAFALHHAEDVIVENCHFIQAQGRGHCFDLNGCRRVTVRNCVFVGFLNRGGRPYAFEECIQLDQSMPGSVTFPDETASYDALFTRDVRVLGCQFLPLELNGVTYPCPNPVGGHAAREGHAFLGVEFRGNRVVDPHEDPSLPEEEAGNAKWRGAIHFPAVQGIVIADNEFVMTRPRATRAITIASSDRGALDTQPPLPVIERGMFPPVPSSDIVVRNNVFRGFGSGLASQPQAVIGLRGVPGGLVAATRIEGNTFDAGPADNGQGTWAVTADHCVRLTIADNQFSSLAGAVRLAATSDFVVRHNGLSGGPHGSVLAAFVATDGSHDGTFVQNSAPGFGHQVDTTGSGPRVRVV